MKRKLRWPLMFVVAVVLGCGLCVSAWAVPVTGTLDDNFSWSFEHDTLTISGEGENNSFLSSSAFSGIDLSTVKHLIFKNGITHIRLENYDSKNLFPNLESVEIPASFESVPSFIGCTNLTDVNIPDSLFMDYAWCFQGTPWLTKQGNFVTLNDTLIHYQGTGDGDIKIPNGVKHIAPWAFAFCREKRTDNGGDIDAISNNIYEQYLIHLTGNVILPDSLEELSNAVFSYTKITSITLPKNVISIGEMAFQGCEQLTSITLPSSLKEIGYSAFWGCDNLTSIEIPASVTKIGDSAFYDCSHLSVLSNLSGIKTIGVQAFANCALSEVTLPKTIKSIGVYAFGYDGGRTPIEDFTITGYRNTAAETYAKNNYFEFIPLDPAPDNPGGGSTTIITNPAHKHTWNSGTVTAPTCGSLGYTTYTCADCGEISKSDYTLSKTGHVLKTVTAVEPTYESTGTQQEVCENCGMVYITRTLSKKTLKKPTLSSLKNAAAKKLTVKWNAVPDAEQYEVQYATSSNFKGAKTVNSTAVSKTISKLSKGKTYYVRVRACKGGVKSPWSAKKSLTIKK